MPYARRPKNISKLEQEMKSVYARHGFPKLTHSSPGYPQSNGLAERMVKTVKQALKKAAQTGTDTHLAILSLRNTSDRPRCLTCTDVDGTSPEKHAAMHSCVVTAAHIKRPQQTPTPVVSPEAVLQCEDQATSQTGS